jgi:hypothetical protein
VLDFSRPGLEALVYATFFGGSSFESPKTVLAGVDQQIYMSGYTLSSDFPTTLDAYRMDNAGEADTFVARLDWARSPFESLIYSTYLGGSGSDLAYSMALDPAGQVLLTGYTYSTDFPLKGAASGGQYQGAADAFFAWLDPSKPMTEGLACSMYVGSPGIEIGNGVAPDASGNVFIAGSTTSQSLPADPGAFQPASGGFAEVFVTKISAAECAPPSQ